MGRLVRRLGFARCPPRTPRLCCPSDEALGLTEAHAGLARLYRNAPHHRRLVPRFVRDLGTAPLRALPLPMGSYLLSIRAEGRAPVRYPVHIGRQEHWDGVPPGALDPSRCCMRDSHPGRMLPAPMSAYPVDESVYGVRHTGGNVRQWCCDPFVRDGRLVTGARVPPATPFDPDSAPGLVCERGGNWVGDIRFCRVARRYGLHPASRDASLGFRLFRSL